MMFTVHISVEGQTEETFVTEVLRPHFQERGLWLNPVIVKTRRLSGKPTNKGGSVPYNKVKKELLNLLGDTSAKAVTTMYDFYALPHDFPGYSQLPQGNGAERVTYLERKLRNDVDNPRFHPYLQLHEFEALLFTDPQEIYKRLSGTEAQLDKLKQIRKNFHTPEDINEGRQTAPSKRLRSIFPGYQKTVHGSLITMEIGLETLAAACPHFAQWLTWLESLAPR